MLFYYLLAISFRISVGAGIPNITPILEYPQLPEDTSGDDAPPSAPPTLSVRSRSADEVITGDANCICGRPRLTGGRVVGGELAKINDLPWTAAIVMKDTGANFCGATLICSQYVLTAAHCMDFPGNEASKLEIVLNEEDFDEENENAEPSLRIDVTEITFHPDWDKKTLNNDACLLKLATPVNITMNDGGSMVPACLPANNDNDYAGMDVTVAGWGATAYGRHSISKLQRLTMPVITNEVCKTTYYKQMITENMMCAGFLEGGKDACRGDSGGPLVLDEFGKYSLVGVVSFGYKCAEKNAPGVYSRVGRFADWIREKTADCQYCMK